jgi:hypothetical protein
MTTDVEKRLRRAFIANGGSEQDFEASKADLLTQYRNQATITSALEEASRPLTMNDLLRGAMQERDDQSNDLLRHIVAGGANQKGDDNAPSNLL